MKNDKYRTYIYWGVTALAVLLLLVAAVFVVIRWSLVAALGAKIAHILAPVIYGAVFAYLLNPVYNRVQAAVMKLTKDIIPDEKGRKRLGGFFGTLASMCLLVAVVVGLISMLIPQLINSISGVMETLPASINNLEIWLEKVLADNPDLEQQVMQHYGAAADYLQNWLTNVVVPNIYRIIGSVSSGVVLVVRAVFDILIGLIVMVYLLNMKEKPACSGQNDHLWGIPVKDRKQSDRGRTVCASGIWRIHHWKTAGFPDHRPDLFCAAWFCEYAVCAAGQCHRRCDQCDPVFRSVYRSNPECIPDPAVRPNEVPVFPDFYTPSAAV